MFKKFYWHATTPIHGSMAGGVFPARAELTQCDRALAQEAPIVTVWPFKKNIAIPDLKI